MRPRIYISELGDGYTEQIRRGLEYVRFGQRIRRGDTVFFKPNLTFPVFRKGVMTNPACVESLVIALKDYTDRIIVGEADSGGYNRFNISEVFEKTGINALGKKYGVRAVNLSFFPKEPVYFDYKGRSFELLLPTMLLHEVDQFITVPVPKVHMNTQMSVAIKNQWGCIPEPTARLKLHPFFEKVIYEVNKNIRANMAVVDGRYGLNHNGPMVGDVVGLNWIMVADNILATDVAVCRLMQINPLDVYYLKYIDRKEERLPELEEIEFSQDYKPFIGPRFYLKPSVTDRLCRVPFRSPFFSYLAYFSPLADFLHKLLYLVRKPMYNYEAPGLTRVEESESSEAVIAESDLSSAQQVVRTKPMLQKITE